MVEGQQLWWQRWKREGFEEGKREGFEQGKREGERYIIRFLIEKRFGPLPGWAQQQLMNATHADLVRWGEMVVNGATALEQLLGR